MTETTSPAPSSAPVGGITLWPVDVLARHLLSADPLARTVALGMAVLPGAPVDRCVDALVECSRASTGDPLASQLAATALGSLPPASSSDAVLSCLAAFSAGDQPTTVRMAAAHALFRLGHMPADAREPVCARLFDPDPNARKVALLAITPSARDAAGVIARQVAGAAAAWWTVEALQALVSSAGDDASARSKIEAYLVRLLAGVPLMPAGVAGYACLARLEPDGAATAALLQVAADSDNPEAAGAALEALGALGKTAQAAAGGVAKMLAATDDPAREDLLCRTLVRLQVAARDVPMARVMQRLQNAPERSTAAHCMLLCLHPKDFAQAAPLVRQRFLAAGPALQKALAQTYKTLTGTELTGDAVAAKV
jgi:hypothetical protein